MPRIFAMLLPVILCCAAAKASDCDCECRPRKEKQACDPCGTYSSIAHVPVSGVASGSVEPRASAVKEYVLRPTGSVGRSAALGCAACSERPRQCDSGNEIDIRFR